MEFVLVAESALQVYEKQTSNLFSHNNLPRMAIVFQQMNH